MNKNCEAQITKNLRRELKRFNIQIREFLVEYDCCTFLPLEKEDQFKGVYICIDPNGKNISLGFNYKDFFIGCTDSSLCKQSSKKNIIVDIKNIIEKSIFYRSTK